MLNGRQHHIDRPASTRRSKRSIIKGGTMILTASLGALLLMVASCSPKSEAGASGEEVTLLHVSYDIAREIYRNINAAFIPHYESETG